eukprot:tig00000615_g2605.t1
MDGLQVDKIEIPLPLDLAKTRFLLTCDAYTGSKEELKKQLLDAVVSRKMAPLYAELCTELGWQKDEALLESMKTANRDELAKLEETLADAEKNLGENEVREALVAKADFFARIGDKENALTAYRVAGTKTVALGQRIDLVLATLRIGLFWMDVDVVVRNLEKAKSLVEEGGDWERRNRLRVYEATWCMATRDFKKAATLYLECLATFTAYELCSFNDFVFYTVMTSMVSLDRVSLQKKVVDAPEILSVIGEIPYLRQYVDSLHNCKYSAFFDALANLATSIKVDRYLAAHLRFYMREMRVVAYAQFLESYQSVTINSMATAFGVSADFLDRELSQFIASNRIHCKIDKVAGIIETNRPDSKNSYYQQMIKQGDLLLNRLQKLSRVINV